MGVVSARIIEGRPVRCGDERGYVFNGSGLDQLQCEVDLRVIKVLL